MPTAAMIDRLQQSPFLTADAVTAWDTWFRWREDGKLRDVSVDATWLRVAQALSEAEPTDGARWSTRFFAAQSRWELIFDERILATAGTGSGPLPHDAIALLNPAAFVEAPFAADARFDFAAFRSTAALAVRALDNVHVLLGGNGGGPVELRIGLSGVADALALLGKRYDRAGGRVMAGEIARALAEGCLEGSVRLARERGPASHGTVDLQDLHAFELPAELLAESARHGVRHARLTEISSQPRLARFANRIADALDPIAAPGTEAEHIRRPPAFPFALARSLKSTVASAAVVDALAAQPVALSDQIELRGAVQPWIDRPIDYPFRTTGRAAPGPTAYWHRVASAHRLGEMTLAKD